MLPDSDSSPCTEQHEMRLYTRRQNIGCQGRGGRRKADSIRKSQAACRGCLLYTSDAADDM
eukprot:8033178-Karenia_brevis.AAC.1